MKATLSARCFGLFALALSISASPVIAEPINTDRFGLYVVVDDIDRASTFYEQLFGVPEIKMPSLVGFDVAGGLYAVVSRNTYAVNAVRGDTMRAYINVSDIEETFTCPSSGWKRPLARAHPPLRRDCSSEAGG